MGDKLITTIRFNSDGVEAELYRKIQTGKQIAGLSVPEYVKTILLEHFEKVERHSEEKSVLQEIREEYQKMAGQLERVFRQSLQEHDAILLGAINRIGAVPEKEKCAEIRSGAKLPEAGEEVPEGALDFLNEM